MPDNGGLSYDYGARPIHGQVSIFKIIYSHACIHTCSFVRSYFDLNWRHWSHIRSWSIRICPSIVDARASCLLEMKCKRIRPMSQWVVLSGFTRTKYTTCWYFWSITSSSLHWCYPEYALLFARPSTKGPKSLKKLKPRSRDPLKKSVSEKSMSGVLGIIAAQRQSFSPN